MQNEFATFERTSQYLKPGMKMGLKLAEAIVCLALNQPRYCNNKPRPGLNRN